ncbi:MAG: ribosome small subunit-dependent GTPase A [Clostridiales bacterium]|jgi:ribosome biogenesis GTPase|nr:ribosome small subunit-dependent GTPase A [Clostridia bacterium]NLD03512.1 ribosome small subunit-dependent GTPase A [Clostridiales bacterium]
MIKGEIKEGRGGFYTVRDETGQEHILRAKKKFRRDGISPLPGDRVMLSPGSGEEHGWLEEILPRASLCLRPPVANITLMVIVIAPEPVPDYLLVDKLLVYADMQGIRPLIAVNKSDIGMETYEKARDIYKSSGAPVIALSASSGQGLDELCSRMRGELTGFAGQSGVGKSALLSMVTGTELISGAISDRIKRGKQTTRHTTLLYHDGMRVMDTPGFSLLELPRGMEPEQLSGYYPDFRPYEADCRFNPCLHLTEPGCAVKKACEAGDINASRLLRYGELMETVKKTWRERYD